MTTILSPSHLDCSRISTNSMFSPSHSSIPLFNDVHFPFINQSPLSFNFTQTPLHLSILVCSMDSTVFLLCSFHSFNHNNIITSFKWIWITTVWIVLSSKQSTLTMSVNSLDRTRVLNSLNVISPSSGRDVINVIQWSQGQDVRHVTMVSRVMGMEVVFHVHLMNVVD